MSGVVHGPCEWVISRRVAARLLVMGSCAALAACAAPTPTAAPTTIPSKPAAPAPTQAKPTIAAPTPPAPTPSPAPKPTQAPTQVQKAKVTIGHVSQTGLAFAPLFIARAGRFFEDEAIEPDAQFIQTNPLAVASLISGESHFVVTGSSEQLVAHEKGLGFITVAGFPNAVTLEIAARNEFLRQRGITPNDPLKDKIGALKGAKIGVGSLSGTVAQYSKYTLKVGGLDPDLDADFIAVTTGPPTVAAIRAGQVDAIATSPPEPQIIESEGFGSVFIALGEEVPALKYTVYEALYGRKAWIEQNASVTERVCRAIGRANNLIRNDLPAAKKLVKAALPQLDPNILDIGMDRVRQAFGADARMTEEMWKNAADVFIFAGTIKGMPPIAEGILWTNRYLVNVPKG